MRDLGRVDSSCVALGTNKSTTNVIYVRYAVIDAEFKMKACEGSGTTIWKIVDGIRKLLGLG